MFKTLIHGLKEFAFPDNCLLCRQYLKGDHQTQLCPLCENAIEANTPTFCLSCPRHLDSYSSDGYCPDCHRNPPFYDRAWAVCRYNDPMRKLIHRFKYEGKTGLRVTFAKLVLSFIKTYHVPMEQFDLMLPIPLHGARFRERGYNQSELLTEILHMAFPIPLSTGNLLRIKNTSPQAFLEQKERWTNIQGAFTINHSFNITNKSILLIDDLLTTGATASAAAAALKNAGAKNIGLLVVALAK